MTAEAGTACRAADSTRRRGGTASGAEHRSPGSRCSLEHRSFPSKTPDSLTTPDLLGVAVAVRGASAVPLRLRVSRCAPTHAGRRDQHQERRVQGDQGGSLGCTGNDNDFWECATKDSTRRAPNKCSCSCILLIRPDPVRPSVLDARWAGEGCRSLDSLRSLGMILSIVWRARRSTLAGPRRHPLRQARQRPGEVLRASSAAVG